MNKIKAIFWLCAFATVAILFSLISVVIQPIAIILAIFGSGKYQRYGINCLEGLDNYRSAQSGGDPDESISSRLGKAKLRGSSLTFLADRVDLVAAEIFGDENHSIKSVERDEGKKKVTGY
jgi:hypothetical protein